MLTSKTLVQDIYHGFLKVVLIDRINMYYLIYYSMLESILMLTVPLASSFLINALLAHASVSTLVVGGIVLTVMIVVLVLQLAKEYIVEKLQQMIFVKNAIHVGEHAQNCDNNQEEKDKYMNYFFDILSIQKIFPLLVLDGVGLVIKVVISLLLLLAFDRVLFLAGVILFVVMISGLLYLGRNGFVRSIERSDAKHEAIYYLQNMEKAEELPKLDQVLNHYVNKRRSMFHIIFRQMSWMFLMEVFIISGFFILGGLLVINGTLPVGEFVASEIIVVTIGYAIHGFVKQLDYFYDMAEGIYKVNKLSKILTGGNHE